MKFRGKEKYFWERNFNIKNPANIPTSISGITGIDSTHDDEFFFFLCSRVSVVERIYLRCTDVTDEGVRHIGKLQGLKELTLKDHQQITKACLPDINNLTELEFLDVSKSNILPEDLLILTNFKKLRGLIITTDKNESERADVLYKLTRHFPDCEISLSG